MAPTSSGGAAARVRRRTAARARRRNTSSKSRSPRPWSSDLSPAHACRASCPSPKAGSVCATPRPAAQCASWSRSPRTARVAVAMSAGAFAPSADPQRPTVTRPSYDPALVSSPSGRGPP
eukprot:3058146-Pleurochrysis_carterae.AAC.2